MPVTPTFPGVYIEEVPSGVHPITGVATSITAFIGRALRGPVDEAITITAYGDFERIYGGLWLESNLGYAVNDFYRNGGSTAIIVRVHKKKASDTAGITLGTAAAEKLVLEASSPGEWGSKLSATIDNLVKDTSPPDTTLFNLTVTDTATGKVESFRNVSFASGSPRRVDLVLAAESTLVVMKDPLPTSPQSAFPVIATATNGNDGDAVDAALYTTGANLRTNKKGLYALENADIVNLLVIPPYTAGGEIDSTVLADTIAYAEERRAVVIMDPPAAWTSLDKAVTGASAGSFTSSKNAAVYFPRVNQPDALRDGQIGIFAPCGAIAGVIARTDADRGVWKAPAGLDATLRRRHGARASAHRPRERRAQPARRQLPADVPRRRAHRLGCAHARGRRSARLASGSTSRSAALALFLEESLYRGTQWVVFEPNDEPLWAQIRLNVGAFMHGLFRQGAFQGTTPQRGVLRQVRRRDDDAGRHQPRHRQHRGRLRAAEAGRVRGHQAPADGRQSD